MNRKLIIYIVLLVAIIGVIILIDAGKPKPVNWSPTYAVNDKIPFGLYVLERESGSFFKGSEIAKIGETPYEYFDARYSYEDSIYSVKGSFISIDENNTIDDASARELMFFAEHGNTVFLSMKSFPRFLLDTLQVEVASGFYLKDSVPLTLTAPGAGSQKYYFAQGVGFTRFSAIDTLTTTLLGHQEIDTLKQANFIRVPFGNGNFLLHTQPAVFTNFHLLKGNHHEYAEKVLSHIPHGNIYWHARNFPGGVKESDSVLRYILAQPALKWAWYLGLIALVIFIFFNAKRKQRIIPEVAPLRNTTVDFTKTIGNLYFQEGSHHTIIEKKIIYFLEHVRNEYLIDTFSLDEEFIEKLHLKTGKPVEDIEKAVHLIKNHRNGFASTEADVIAINKAIENLRT